MSVYLIRVLNIQVFIDIKIKNFLFTSKNGRTKNKITYIDKKKSPSLLFLIL